MLTKPKVYQMVWFMENNLPKTGAIYSIKETASNAGLGKTHIIIEIGKNQDAIKTFHIDNLYESKDDLKKEIFK